MIRVFLVDRHHVVRQRLAALIDARRDLEVVGQADSMQQALVSVAGSAPDVVVLGGRLPDGDGVQLGRIIRAADPGIRCLMLTDREGDAACLGALLAGASGHLPRDVGGKALADAVRAAASGRSLISPATAERVLSAAAEAVEPTGAIEAGGAASPRPRLSLRERQVLKLIREGLTNREIGDRLDLPERIVREDVSGLLARIDLAPPEPAPAPTMTPPAPAMASPPVASR
jgi:DNA-binding NarL/FixJ family response regulator